ncbi:MAG: valine--pyruvate transaminase [Gammaproteobacteria bacterium]
MSIRFSAFGRRFQYPSGTRQLMDDLGKLRRSGHYLNLGGGNPSRIPEMHEWFAEKLSHLAHTRELDEFFATYDSPRGNHRFIAVLGEFFTNYFGVAVSPENVMCTGGSQASFFMLFNLFGGSHRRGRKRRILLPQSPEYVGYSGLGIEHGTLVAYPSRISFTASHRFKYEIDFDGLMVDETIGAICLSRPCNPTGNVVSDNDLARLAALAEAFDIPLIVDCAYGDPFPGIMFVPNRLAWSEKIVFCFSLSKLGLPGMRTGIVLGSEEITDTLVGMNATMALANNSLGPRLAHDLFSSGAVLDFATRVIRPYYLARSHRAIACCDEYFSGLDYFVHESEGAIFLWVWFRGLPIPAQTLYERLKARGVLVIPGHHFALGKACESTHAAECIRISYAQDDAALQRGIAIIAEEAKAAFASRRADARP